METLPGAAQSPPCSTAVLCGDGRAGQHRHPIPHDKSRFIRVKPPVREPGHAEPLWAALRDGLIDMISTDHAPHLPEEKRRPSIWDCAPGFPGVETSLPLMLTAVNAGRLTLPDVVRAACAAPARAFGLSGKGLVAVGMDADLVLVDMRAEPSPIRAAALQSIGRATPFEGLQVDARPVRTLCRGRTVARATAPPSTRPDGAGASRSSDTPRRAPARRARRPDDIRRAARPCPRVRGTPLSHLRMAKQGAADCAIRPFRPRGCVPRGASGSEAEPFERRARTGAADPARH